MRRARVAATIALAGGFGCGGEPKKPAPFTALTVTRAFVVLPAGESPAALYATITNGTAVADTLVAVELAGARAMLHGPMPDMAMLDALPVAPGATERLGPGGRHGMVTGFTGHARGDSLAVTFRFTRVGAVVVKARVIGYADVDTAAPPVR
ncbi:MAG: copper chaperone PCu(A)C [Gemmatimonadetes bacterium]|nr:copper chaperone PCu(A)C [Gemmatimonadota bacterium]